MWKCDAAPVIIAPNAESRLKYLATGQVSHLASTVVFERRVIKVLQPIAKRKKMAKS